MQEISHCDSRAFTVTYTAVKRRAGGRSWRGENCPRHPPRTTWPSAGLIASASPPSCGPAGRLTIWPRVDGCRVCRETSTRKYDASNTAGNINRASRRALSVVEHRPLHLTSQDRCCLGQTCGWRRAKTLQRRIVWHCRDYCLSWILTFWGLGLIWAAW